MDDGGRKMAEKRGRAGNHDISNRHTRRFGKYTSRFEQNLPSRHPIRIRVPTLACGSLAMDARRRGDETGMGEAWEAWDATATATATATGATLTHPPFQRPSSSLDSVRGARS